MKTSFAVFIAAAAGFVSLAAFADTTEVKTQSTVIVTKRGAHCADDPHCMNRYHYAIKPVMSE